VFIDKPLNEALAQLNKRFHCKAVSPMSTFSPDLRLPYEAAVHHLRQTQKLRETACFGSPRFVTLWALPASR
jgi:hypothetical protein